MTSRSPIQVSTQLATRNITLSAETAEELQELTDALLQRADAILDNFVAFDQMVLAKNPNPPAPVSTSGANASQPRSTPPPSGDTPVCPEHGPAKDMAGKRTKAGQPYKNRYYCSKYGCETFQPQGEWVG